MENLLLCSKTLYDKDLLDKKREIEKLRKENEELKEKILLLENTSSARGSKRCKRTRSRKPRVYAVQSDGQTVTLDAVCDVNFQIHVKADYFTFLFDDPRPGLQGKIVIDCERESPSTDITVYVPTGTTYVYDRHHDSFQTIGSLPNTSTTLQLRSDSILIPPQQIAIIDYYFDNRNLPIFDITHSYIPVHSTMPFL